MFAFSATNPCHLWPLVRELHSLGVLDCFYSGYPKWKLPGSDEIPVTTVSTRTVLTYGMLRMPERFRPSSHSLFKWQDEGFDRSVAKALTCSPVLHGLPGQCLHTFRRAKELGTITVLNHASGPVEHQVELVRPEFEHAGLKLEDHSRFDSAYFEREREEYRLADFHCAASSIVKDQLVSSGIDASKIFSVPYGADTEIFRKRSELPRDDSFRIVFAGALSLRKGIRYLLNALEISEDSDWHCHFYGARSTETNREFDAYKGGPAITRHGAVSAENLAQAFRNSSVLVLPSAEEAFGMVVVQALQCGLPCIVSDRVGAQDLIEHRKNGSIVPFGDSNALVKELQWWQANPKIVADNFSWKSPAQTFLERHNSIEAIAA